MSGFLDAGLLEKRIGPYLNEGKAYASQCLNGTRWQGNAFLIVLDASLTSMGFSYFQFVQPRVTRLMLTSAAGELTLRNATSLVARKSWFCPSERCKAILLRAAELFSDSNPALELQKLRDWAQIADPIERKDEFSRTKGLGTFSIQYLRGQVGLDVPIPDRLVKRVLTAAGWQGKGTIDLMNGIREAARALGIRNLDLVWSIWLSEDLKRKRTLTRSWLPTAHPWSL